MDTTLTPKQCIAIANSMPQLVGMTLEGNESLDDEAIAPFSTMTKLTSLKLNGTRVSAAGVEALQKALPDCMISWDGEAK